MMLDWWEICRFRYFFFCFNLLWKQFKNMSALFLFHSLCICVYAFLQSNNQIRIVCLEYDFHYMIEIRKVEEVTALETCQMITLYTGLNNIQKNISKEIIFFPGENMEISNQNKNLTKYVFPNIWLETLKWEKSSILDWRLDLKLVHAI